MFLFTVFGLEISGIIATPSTSIFSRLRNFSTIIKRADEMPDHSKQIRLPPMDQGALMEDAQPVFLIVEEWKHMTREEKSDAMLNEEVFQSPHVCAPGYQSQELRPWVSARPPRTSICVSGFSIALEQI